MLDSFEGSVLGVIESQPACPMKNTFPKGKRAKCIALRRCSHFLSSFQTLCVISVSLKNSPRGAAEKDEATLKLSLHLHVLLLTFSGISLLTS